MLADRVAHQFDHQHRLAHPGPTEESDLAATRVGSEQVYGLDAGDEWPPHHALIAQRGRSHVNGPPFFRFWRGLSIYRLPQHVEHPSQSGPTHRHADGAAGIYDGKPTPQAGGRAHGDRPHGVGIHMLLNLGHQVGAVVRPDQEGVMDAGQVAGGEFGIHHHAGNPYDDTGSFHDTTTGHRNFQVIIPVLGVSINPLPAARISPRGSGPIQRRAPGRA